MNIAYLINQYPKVSHSFIRREILELENQGLSITRIAMRGWSESLVDSTDIAEKEKTIFLLKEPVISFLINVIKCLITHPAQFVCALKMCFKLARFSDRLFIYNIIYFIEACSLVSTLKRYNIRHIHSHFGTNSTEVALYAHLISGITYSFTVHGPEEFDRPINIGLTQKINNAKFIIAITHFCASQLYRWCNYKHWKKIKIVGCGLDNKFLNNDEIICTTEDNKTLVCVGRICEQKGQLFLIDAVNDVLKSGHQIKLILAGDGEMRSQVENKIKEYGISEYVSITGWISSDDVKKYILQSRAMILPSFAEGLPVVIMEAMALKRPVITTYIAGIPELVTHKKNGWLFPAGDNQALSAAMIECLSCSAEQLKSIGLHSFRAVKTSHDIVSEAGKLKKLFSE